MRILLFFLIFVPSIALAQNTINGRITNLVGEKIIGATITITDTGSKKIISYSVSDENGNYFLKTPSNYKQFFLNIKSIGYRAESRIIENKTQTINFSLIVKATELKEVIAKNNPVTKRNDTLNYDVQAFASEQDRTIADVLKKLPGIEVLPDGKVLYQGKPINKYYIEGMDLLEGKYNIANENLPHKEVSKVQVIENHQPIKMLDSLVFSDRAALNIKLKNKYTFTGQAQLGAGFAPAIWNTNITPMLFAKNQQFINSYQTNNIGNNIATQIKPLTMEDFLENFENDDSKKDWLSIQQLSAPSFSEKRWLDNNAHLLSINHLKKINNDYELRLNVSYLNDYQKQQGSTNTFFFTPVDTILLLENKFNQLYFNSLDANLTLQKNTSSAYFKNSLQYQGFWDSQRGTLTQNYNPLLQNLNNRYFKLTNKLKALIKAGKKIITFNSYFGIYTTPQQLMVNPGQFIDLVNNGVPYEKMQQEIHLKTIYANNSVSFTKGWKKFSFTPKIGFQIENQFLQSNLNTFKNSALPDSFFNHLDWKKTKLYANLKTQFRNKKWDFEIMLPVNYYSYKLEDVDLKAKQNINQLTFEPNFLARYALNNYWNLSASLTRKVQFGNIEEIYYAYILKNYRTIQRINAPLPQQLVYSINGGISYRNPLKVVFANLMYVYSHTSNNLLYANSIMPNGASELKAIPQKNTQQMHNFSARVTKYVSSAKTNISFATSASLQSRFEIINNILSKIENKSLRINPSLNTDITQWLKTEINAQWIFSRSKVQENENPTITQQIYRFDISLIPFKDQYIGIKNEWIKNDLFSINANNFFSDLVYRYTWKKKRIDFELQWNNIFASKNYQTINIDAFQYVETNFQLRPQQILFMIKMSL